MNVVSQMIKDHEQQNASEFGAFADNHQDTKWIKRIRNIIVVFLVSLIAGLGVLQYKENASQKILAEQVVDLPAKMEKVEENKVAAKAQAQSAVLSQVSKPVSHAKVDNQTKPDAVVKTNKSVNKQPERAVVIANVGKPKKISPKATQDSNHKAAKKPEVVVSKSHEHLAKNAAKVATNKKPQKPKLVASAVQEPKPFVSAQKIKAEPKDVAEMTKELRRPSKTQLAQQTYSAAIKLIKKKRVKKAEEYLKRALELNVQHVRAREILAGLYIKQKRQAEVIKLLSDGLNENPTYFKFRQLLARLYVDQNKIKQALEVLDGATDLQKDSPNYLSFIAAINQQAGNYEKARKSYQAALELKPGEGSWWLGLGLAFESSEKFNEAEKAYIRAKQIGNVNNDILQYIERRLAAVRLHTVSMN